MEILDATFVADAERRVREFYGQSLTNTAWAFAKVHEPDEKFFSALAKAVEHLASEFNAQELASTAWAFAKVPWTDEELFSALATAAERRTS